MKLWLRTLIGILIFYFIMIIITTISPVFFGDFFNNEKKDIVITSHRGAAGYAPENTLAAIKKGLESDVNRIEVDIHQSKDGKLIIIHDEILDRTTNRHGMVKDFNYEDLLKLDAGSWFSDKYTSEKLPLLEDAFRLIDGKATFVIELKHGSDFYPGIEKKVVSLIHEFNAYDWVVVHSFDDKVLKKFREIDTNIVLHKLFIFKTNLFPLIYDTHIHKASLKDYSYVKEISVYYKFINKSLVDRAHKLGLKINAWTVNDPDIALRLVKMGVDGIITDFPKEIKLKLSY